MSDPPNTSKVRERMGANSRVKLLGVLGRQCVAFVGPVLLAVSDDEPSAEYTRSMAKWTEDLAAQYPAGGAWMVVLQASSPPPNAEARRHIDQLYKSFERGCVAGAIVIEGKGFLAASIRSAVSLSRLLQRFSYSMKIFATVREASAWLCAELPEASAYNAHELVQGVDDLRRAFYGDSPVAARSGD